MTKYSVKKPFTVLVGVVLIAVLSVISFLGLNTDLLPTLDLPYVIAITTYPGASPEKVEMSVTKPLEQALSTTNGLENIQSISSENQSIIIMEFSQTINMDTAMIEMSGSIDLVKGYLDATVSAPMLMKLNPDMLPVQILSVDVEGMDIKQLTQYVENELSSHLERINGVATVDVSGSVKNYVDIKLDAEKIEQINDDILKAVNKELYKTKKDLDKAKNELANGKSELESKKEDAYTKMAEGSAQLDSGMAQLMSITAEADQLEAHKGILQGAQKILQAKDQLAPLFAGMALVPDSDTTISDTIAALAAQNPQNPIIQMLEGAKAAGIIADSDTVTMAKEKCAQTEKGFNDQLAAMGVTATSATIDAELAALDAQITQAKFLKAQMQQTVSQLQKAYADLEKAKMQAVESLAVVGAELSSAEKELEKGSKEFENARDQALKSANIDSLVTQSMINNILQAQNFSMPAGYIKIGEEKITVKVGDKFADLEQLKNLLLLDMDMKNVDPIYLSDVAQVEIKDDAEDSFVRINGNPGVILSLQKSSIASTSEVSKSVNKAIKDLQAENENLHISSLMDQGDYIKMVVDSVMSNLVYGGIIALFVLLFFLKDMRPTLIIGFSIPISLMFAVVLMYFSGVTLNIISLSGLALGVGMLVDNSIVVIENTYRLRNLGYSKVKSAVMGAQQVGGAIFASTLTTICVFLPIVFTQGISRQIFTDMGITIGYSLVASLIVAMTFVPALSSNILNSATEKESKWFDKFVTAYEKMLIFNLNHKWIVIIGSLALLAFSAYQTMTMPMAFIPSMDSPQMQMTLTLPKDTSDDDLYKESKKIADTVQKIQDVQTVAIMSGGGGMMSMGGASDGKSISFFVVLKDEKTLTNTQVEQLIKQETTEYENQLTITTDNMDMSALGGSGISIAIKGNDLDRLQNIATDLSTKLATINGVKSADDGMGETLEEVRIDIDKEKAMQHGLTTAQVYQKVSDALKEKTTSTTLTFDNEDLTAYISETETQTKDTLTDIQVATKTDDKNKETIITLGDIAAVKMASSPKSISRVNQSRTKTITAEIADGQNATLVSRDVEKFLSTYQMPSGYSYELGGENETIMSAMKDLVLMILLAIVFIYLIMVAQFQSLLSPFIVLFTIPLAFTGGLLALQMTGTVLSVVSMIGFLILAGVVVNNGIVFVDYVNQLRLEGMDKKQALVKAGRDRIRPILMTALTTILAMSTMAFGVGMGADMSQGMAIVTIGGLSYATILTLFLVPALYDILHRRRLVKIDVNFEENENATVH